MEKKFSVVYLRSFATLLIFLCHILLISGFEKSSMWLNVGVQIFFLMSAYLLTNKKLASFNEIKKFMIKRCKKVFISYWLYVIAISLVLLVIHRQPSLGDFLIYFFGMKGFFGSANILGLGHLWFVTVILVCYFLTPILYYISRIESKLKRITNKVICVLVVIAIMVGLRCYSYSIYILSYMFAYFYVKHRKGSIKKIELFVWVCLAIVFSVLRLLIDSSGINTLSWYELYDGICVPFLRTFLGMGITVLFLYFEKFFSSIKKCHWIENFADLSYEFYLTHQFIQLSLWEFVGWFRTPLGIGVWSALSFGLSWCSAYLLKRLTTEIEKSIRRKRI